jgi:hypothetical protein
MEYYMLEGILLAISSICCISYFFYWWWSSAVFLVFFCAWQHLYFNKIPVLSSSDVNKNVREYTSNVMYHRGWTQKACKYKFVLYFGQLRRKRCESGSFLWHLLTHSLDHIHSQRCESGSFLWHLLTHSLDHIHSRCPYSIWSGLLSVWWGNSHLACVWFRDKVGWDGTIPVSKD